MNPSSAQPAGDLSKCHYPALDQHSPVWPTLVDPSKPAKFHLNSGVDPPENPLTHLFLPDEIAKPHAVSDTPSCLKLDRHLTA
jgi:hypothetical protein